MSFSDLMSSGKGPGVIGLLLALVVLGGFLLLGTLTLDEQFQGGGRTITSVISNQEEQIESLRRDLEYSEGKLASLVERKRIADDLAKAKVGVSRQQALVAELGVKVADTGEEITALKHAFEDYKTKYRTVVRDAAKGTALDEFETLDGEVYKQVSIREVNSVGMLISHRDGSKRIPYANLPREMQDLYQFDAEEMEAKKAAEALARKQHLLATAAAQKASQEQSEQNQIEQQRANTVKREQAISAISSRITSLTDEIRTMESNIDSETQKKFSRAPQLREQLVVMRREKVELESKLRGLRANP
jgi:hypothetical protein